MHSDIDLQTFPCFAYDQLTVLNKMLDDIMHACCLYMSKSYKAITLIMGLVDYMLV